MKKTLFLLVLAFMLLSGRAAADCSLRSVQFNVQSNTLYATARTTEVCALYTVLYSAAGQELGVSGFLVDTTGGYDETVEFPNAFSCELSDAALARAFLLDYDTLKPLCPRFEPVTLLGGETKSADTRLSQSLVYITPDRASTVDYILLPYVNSLLPDLLKAPFWGDIPTGGAAAPAAFPAYGEIRTVLDAMRAGADSADGDGRGSVFDRYAIQEYRNQTAALIRGASDTSNGILGVGHGVPASPGSPAVVDGVAVGMKEGTQYVLAVTARSVSGGLDVFRAGFPLVLSQGDPEAAPDPKPVPTPGDPSAPTPGDTSAPVITDIELKLKADTYTEVSGTVLTLSSWSGTAVLTFNETLYSVDESVSPPLLRALDRGAPAVERRDTEEFLSIASLVWEGSDTISVVTDDSLTNQLTRTLKLRLSHAEPGDFITFLPTICDKKGNVRVHGMTLTLAVETRHVLVGYAPNTMPRVPVYEDQQTPRLVCSPTSWYPTQS